MFDTQRYRYREGDPAALELLNSGYGTGINRAAMFVPDYSKYPNIDASNENNADVYKIVDTKADGAQYDNIIINGSAFVAPIPAAVSSSSPMLSGPAVDYYAGQPEDSDTKTGN